MRRVRATVLAWSCLGLATLACHGDPSGPAALSTPNGVTVTLVSLTSVRVDWMANPARENVRSYSVLRNGTKVGDATSNTYTDFGLQELATYSYTVTANGVGSATSPPSAVTAQSTFTLPDLTGPTVLSSVPTPNSIGVAIAAAAALTFSEPLDPATVNAGAITMRVTATNDNVAGTVAYAPGATSATFTPMAPLTPLTGYTLAAATTLKDRSGNRLLAAYSTAFTTAAPIDSTPPTIVSFVPVNGSVDVPITTTVRVVFSEDMNASTIDGTSITLAPTAGGAGISATISYTPATRSATLTPVAPLANSTSYTARISTAAKDVAGNALAAIASTRFTTVAPVDNTPPIISAVTPANGATGLPVTSAVTVTFSEAMTSSSINPTTVTLTRTAGAIAVPTTVAYDVATNRATVTPTVNLTLGTGYTVTVGTGARDLAGNALAGVFTSTFATEVSDITPPIVTRTFPTNGATNVSAESSVTATFNELMNGTSLNTNSFTLTRTAGNVLVAGAVTYDAATKTASFVPSVNLAGTTNYTATVTTTARDTAGNVLAAPISFAFTTAVVVDSVAPTVLTVSPAENAVDVARTPSITAQFSEPMDPATITSAAFSMVTTIGAQPVAGTVRYGLAPNTLTFQLVSPLVYGTSYTIALTNSARDLAGNRLVPKSYAFRTVAAPPGVVAVSPTDRSTDVAANAKVTLTFGSPMNAASLTASTFYVRNRSTATLVDGTIAYNSAVNTATFTPTSPLANNNGYQVTVTTGATDSEGRALGSTFESCFTPGPGTGTAVTMTGFWSGDTSCGEIHWHVRLVQTGNTLALASPAACAAIAGDCQLSALKNSGVIALNGTSIAPLASATGTVTGNTVTFTLTTVNGATFTFTGAFASAPGAANAWVIGRISGATLPAVGIAFENQRP